MSRATDRITQAADLIAEAGRVVALTGAGISTPSGIPDFRSQASGLWENANPMIVASIYGFRLRPQAFYEWVYPLAKLTHDAKPNPAHIALAELEALGHLDTVITQNIDALHTQAGSQIVHEVHGHMRTATCVRCSANYDAAPFLEQFMQDRQMPRCPDCNGVLKPDIILFGEQLPVDVLEAAQSAASKADVMLIAGSSLEVAPANELPRIAMRNGARLITVDMLPGDHAGEQDIYIQGDVADVLPAIVQQIKNR